MIPRLGVLTSQQGPRRMLRHPGHTQISSLFSVPVPLWQLSRGGVDFRAVVETGVPVATTLRSEVQEVPDGSEQVDAPLFDVGRHPRMRAVEVPQRAVGAARENGNGRVLMPFAVFTAEVVLEGAVAGAEQPKLVPAASASVSAESREVGGGHHGEGEILSGGRGAAVGAVEP